MHPFPRALMTGLLLAQGLSAMETPAFGPDQLKLPGKKGICLTLRKAADPKGGTAAENMPRVKALQPSWNYSWGTTLVAEQPKTLEFVPMVWAGSKAEKLSDLLRSDVTPKLKSGRVKRLLGFNEPDRPEQANMSPATALALWPTLEKLKVPLCSPSCADPEGEWMKTFIQEAKARKLRVDYIGVHWYGGPNAEAFKTKLKRIHDTYGGRPLLITEFAVADWKTGGDIRKHKHSPAIVLAFMKEILPWLEQQNWIAGYAWFSFGIDTPQGTSSALFDQNGALTACGRYYRSVTPRNPQGDRSIEAEPAAGKKP